MSLVLYEYVRSSASYRARIALNWKGVAARSVPVDIRRGEQDEAPYRGVDAQGRVPALVLEDGTVLIQSPAILEYLDEVYPERPLLPRNPVRRAHVRAMAALIGCDIHPLNNLGVLNYLLSELSQPQEAVSAWYAHWIRVGFEALEQMVGAPFCAGSDVTMADVYLVPQVANARRMIVPLDAFPRVVAIEQACLALPEFAKARPEAQEG